MHQAYWQRRQSVPSWAPQPSGRNRGEAAHSTDLGTLTWGWDLSAAARFLSKQHAEGVAGQIILTQEEHLTGNRVRMKLSW